MKRAGLLVLAFVGLWGCSLAEEGDDLDGAAQADYPIPSASMGPRTGEDDLIFCRAVQARTTLGECELIGEQIDALVQGVGKLDAPLAMNRGDKRMVSLRISPAEEAVVEWVDPEETPERGDEMIAMSPEGSQTEAFDVEISRIMEAQLTGVGFEISPSEPVEKDLGAGLNARWEWEVEAIDSGDLTLSATIKAKALGANGETTQLDLFDTSQDVTVGVTRADKFSDAIVWIGEQFSTGEKTLRALAAMLGALLLVIFGVNRIRKAVRTRAASDEELNGG